MEPGVLRLDCFVCLWQCFASLAPPSQSRSSLGSGGLLLAGSTCFVALACSAPKRSTSTSRCHRDQTLVEQSIRTGLGDRRTLPFIGNHREVRKRCWRRGEVRASLKAKESLAGCVHCIAPLAHFSLGLHYSSSPPELSPLVTPARSRRPNAVRNIRTFRKSASLSSSIVSLARDPFRYHLSFPSSRRRFTFAIRAPRGCLCCTFAININERQCGV